MSETTYPYDTGLVRELLKHKRKARGIRSCFPCRHRKVRCDGQVPCGSCVRRSHPELCQVPTGLGSGGSAGSGSGGGPEQVSPGSTGTAGSVRGEPSLEVLNDQPLPLPLPLPQPDPHTNTLISRLEKIEDQISSLKADLRSAPPPPSTAGTTNTSPQSLPDPPSQGHSQRPHATGKSPGRYFVEDATGATIFLGSHSDTPLTLGCRRASATGDAMIHDAMMDQFVPRAYPFTNLWGPDASAREVCETLPEDGDVIRYWQAYQTTSYPFYPALVTIDQFGPALFSFLDRRAAPQSGLWQTEEPHPSWLALLFAVLACGVQFSDDPIKERDLRSKVLICSAFQCLRMSNFFNQTDLDQIQAMALIGHCQRNNLDTNSAWILMGATMRLAQSIGLHEPSLSSPPAEQYQRNRLWWTLIWQDTFLSFTYDRPSSSITMNCPIPYTPHTNGLTFSESIFTICSILRDRTRQDLSTSTTTTDPTQSALDAKRQLESLRDSVAPSLRSKSHCQSLQDHLERLALNIHLGYAISRLTRVYMGSSLSNDPESDSETIPPAVAADAIHQAMQVIENFLDLHRFSASVCRSWAFVHNAVSCAISLRGLTARVRVPVAGLQGQDPDMLVRRLVAVLEKEEKESEWCDADTNVRYFGPYSRALKALREVYR
ncbi:Zn(II)2Cys6 transcription factor [Aspergillus campestris IBT 28561]|uniref:Zn(II)2Cys6 transcription factor n=1 Tax=Aspergillus campestris (strain IBT 28561) TaxID=1392248 RepID=A0A2I1CZC9_ASPC2|nr:Zn(II)2Cys6 transcription factor [Aspergillus campestris IBT 28561]PKY02990.1 Zn(II)2Cys6 transcription factor [Aspergillus campestris IBT 28561]